MTVPALIPFKAASSGVPPIMAVKSAVPIPRWFSTLLVTSPSLPDCAMTRMLWARRGHSCTTSTMSVLFSSTRVFCAADSSNAAFRADMGPIEEWAVLTRYVAR